MAIHASERYPGVSLSPIVTQIDPTIEGMPAAMVQVYDETNEGIANNLYRDHGATELQHYLRSHASIMRTARFGYGRIPENHERKALILGAGNCIDIPVAKLVDLFDKTVFVDVHTRATERALSTLTARQAAKVSVIQADVTGIMGKVASAIDQVSSGKSSRDRLARNVDTALRQVDPTESMTPELGTGYSFVCSQLLLSQLFSAPFKLVRDRITDSRHQSRPDQGISGNNAMPLESLFALNLGVQLGHIALLHYLVTDRGSVHLADSSSIFKPGPTAIHLPMIAKEVVEPAIVANFEEIRPKTEWVWKTSDSGGFNVVAHALKPRTDA